MNQILASYNISAEEPTNIHKWTWSPGLTKYKNHSACCNIGLWIDAGYPSQPCFQGAWKMKQGPQTFFSGGFDCPESQGSYFWECHCHQYQECQLQAASCKDAGFCSTGRLWIHRQEDRHMGEKIRLAHIDKYSVCFDTSRILFPTPILLLQISASSLLPGFITAPDCLNKLPDKPTDANRKQWCYNKCHRENVNCIIIMKVMSPSQRAHGSAQFTCCY